MYFRFSLVDNNFNIFFNDEQVTIESLSSLANKTQFLWKINNYNDPFLNKKVQLSPNKRQEKTISSTMIKGFIASVTKPNSLKILTTKEKVSVDLFVNGRLREKDILKHIPSARIVENYLYGQIHCDSLDDEKDRFTSSREGIISEDEKFQSILTELKKITKIVTDEWDKWRVEIREDGDPANERLTKKERKSRELFNTVSKDFVPSKDSPNHDIIEKWINSLSADAQFNFSSYAECFVAENIIRNYINHKEIPLSSEAMNSVKKWKRVETDSKNKANISIDIRKNFNDLSYLSMDDLAYLVDMKDKSHPLKTANLSRDADEYKPVRDALAHTSLLTNSAKTKLTTTYENIKARLKKLLQQA